MKESAVPRAGDTAKHTEQASRLAALFELTTDFVATASPDGRMLYCNQAFRDFLGVSEADVPGRSVVDHNLPTYQERVLNEIIPTAIREGRWSGESVYLSVDGNAIPVSLKVFSHKDDLSGEPILSAVIRDISEQKKTEETLRQAQARLEEAQRVARIGSWDFDIATQTSSWSKELFRLLDRDPALGEPEYPELLTMFLPEDAALLMEAIRHAVENGAAYAFDLRRVAADGSLRSYHNIGNPVVDETGKVVRLTGTFMDITEREQLEAQLRQAHKMESIGRLAGGIAHDFNNLLAVIMGYAELVAESLPEKDALQDDIQNIQNAATRAASLTQQLLAFAHKQVVTPTKLQPNAVLARMIPLIQPLIGESIELVTRFDPHAGAIHMDANQLEQIVVNLVANARDAMPEGGKLIMRTENVLFQDTVHYGKARMPAGRYLSLAISDTGIGMTAEVQERLFEPFFTTKEKGKATGLGLATVYGIVKQNRGYVWAYSEIGTGTTLRVWLPCTDGDEEKDVTEAGQTLDRSGTETVLVAEDEPMLRQLTVTALREKGYTVLETADGVEALEVAEKHQGAIHLLVTDGIMPRMGGWELMRRLRANQPGLAVLLVSGYSEEVFTGEAIQSQGICVLPKPFAATDLLDKVREALATRAEG